MNSVAETGVRVWSKISGGKEKEVSPQKTTRLNTGGVILKLVGVKISRGL